ncbi:hypothetical protein [Sphingobium yanoikuyae]|uniref:hypothetical protein n=1 Tax=Sphingobium yanoikuyae TaxID=13690 RepID=UPI0019174A98|nr:hypothetical protein [Sphingobium yanoikuyae]
MILQDINAGTVANDGTGDSPRAGALKINANNALLAAALSGAVAGAALTGAEKLLGLDGSDNKAWLVSQLATYITALIVDSAPGTLDTLNELAAALGDDPNFATTIATALAGKQPLDSDLTAIAALLPANDDVLQRKSGAWINRSIAQLRADLGAGQLVHQSAVNSAMTGTTAETTLATFTIPANSLGPNGSADILALIGYTNSANNKTLRIRINGTQVWGLNVTTTASVQLFFSFANRNAANSQVANANAIFGFGGTTGAEQTFSFDSTADLTVTITGQLATAAEDIHLARRRCLLFHGD